MCTSLVRVLRRSVETIAKSAEKKDTLAQLLSIFSEEAAHSSLKNISEELQSIAKNFFDITHFEMVCTLYSIPCDFPSLCTHTLLNTVHLARATLIIAKKYCTKFPLNLKTSRQIIQSLLQSTPNHMFTDWEATIKQITVSDELLRILACEVFRAFAYLSVTHSYTDDTLFNLCLRAFEVSSLETQNIIRDYCWTTFRNSPYPFSGVRPKKSICLVNLMNHLVASSPKDPDFLSDFSLCSFFDPRSAIRTIVEQGCRTSGHSGLLSEIVFCMGNLILLRF